MHLFASAERKAAAGDTNFIIVALFLTRALGTDRKGLGDDFTR
jgi:hypothetical protein